MLDSLRYLRLSKEEKRQEAITAYLDDVLSPKERERFERQMAAEPALKAEVDAQGSLRYQLRQLPRKTVPRNYTLDPAVYGQPEQPNAFLFYPYLRGATVMAGLLFVVALSAQLLFGSQSVDGLSNIAVAPMLALESADDSFAAEAERVASEPVADEQAIESEIEEGSDTILEAEMVEEEVVEEQESAAPLPAEEQAEEAMAVEIIVTAELEAEEVEMPAEDSAAGGMPAESPPLGESEPERTAAESDGSLVTAEATPTSPATAETELALPAASPAQARSTRQAVATVITQGAEKAEGETIEEPLGKDTAGAPDDKLVDPLQPLLILVIILGIIVLLLAVTTLLIRRRL